MTNLIGDMARSFGLPPLKRAAGVITRRLPIPQPLLMVGPGASARLGQAIGAFAHRKILVVTDAVIAGLGVMKPMLDAIAAGGTACVVFDQVTPDAPIPMIEQGIALFRKQACDAIVAFGGGSAMDAAKAIGLAAANDKHPRELAGYFKGLHGPVPIYAVPTTAGTGSEVTVAAVVCDPADNRKLVIADTRIVPRMAALDPCLMTGLPAPITAATGMDALTHAVEAYIGLWSTEFTDRMALAAVAMIYRNLPLAFADGEDLAAREQMALASTFAGLAFTRANVGNVHAIAHQLGGRYHTHHGLANAIMLGPVLRFCAEAIPAKETFAADEWQTIDEAYAYMDFRPGQKIAGTKIDVAFIGSCTNGRISDLREAARVAKLGRVRSHVKAIVVPGSQDVARQAESEGLPEVFRAAGFEWRLPGCSMCLAMNPDKLSGRQVCASSSNRNFKGRQGSPSGRTLLMSPAMVAAAAIQGAVTDVRALLGGAR